MSLSVTEGMIDIPWGRQSYRRVGAGRPLLLLHSLALGAMMWEPVLDEFAAEHDVIAVDFRGHGRSRWDGTPFDVGDLADDLATLLDALAVERCGVFGLSMGGSVGIALAEQHLGRVERLALCDTTAWYGPDAPTEWAVRADAATAADRTTLVPFQTTRWFTEGFTVSGATTVAHVVDVFVHTDGAAHAQACLALGALDARDRLADISAPTLVITGEEDYATPPQMGRDLAAGIPGAEFRLWPGVRHLSVFESTELRAALRVHLAG